MAITCPKCSSDNVETVGSTHYICNNESCSTDTGARIQFYFKSDDVINFPKNVIFANRDNIEFYKKPYITIRT